MHAAYPLEMALLMLLYQTWYVYDNNINNSYCCQFSGVPYEWFKTRAIDVSMLVAERPSNMLVYLREGRAIELIVT